MSIIYFLLDFTFLLEMIGNMYHTCVFPIDITIWCYSLFDNVQLKYGPNRGSKVKVNYTTYCYLMWTERSESDLIVFLDLLRLFSLNIYIFGEWVIFRILI